MTIWFDLATGDVYDHEMTVIGNLETDTEWDGSWRGRYPNEVLDIARDAMEGSRPSAYNQVLLTDMASENIKQGPPP